MIRGHGSLTSKALLAHVTPSHLREGESREKHGFQWSLQLHSTEPIPERMQRLTVLMSLSQGFGDVWSVFVFVCVREQTRCNILLTDRGPVEDFGTK